MRYFIIAAILFSIGILAPAQTALSQSPPDTVQLQNDPVPIPEPSQKALEYHASGNILWMVDQLWGFLIPAVFLFTGFSSKIRTWAEKLGRRRFFTVGIYFIIFSAIFFVINLPLSYYEDFVRQHAYDLSNQTLGKWFGDALKAQMVGIIIGFLFLWIPYLLL